MYLMHVADQAHTVIKYFASLSGCFALASMVMRLTLADECPPKPERLKFWWDMIKLTVAVHFICMLLLIVVPTKQALEQTHTCVEVSNG